MYRWYTADTDSLVVMFSRILDLNFACLHLDMGHLANAARPSISVKLF